jgi:hypothetical protein
MNEVVRGFFQLFTAGFTVATSNCGFTGGVCPQEVIQLKTIAEHTTYRIDDPLTLICETASKTPGHVVANSIPGDLSPNRK